MKCVLFNSYYSNKLAKETENPLNYVIGTTDKVHNKLAIRFSDLFYECREKCKTINAASIIGGFLADGVIGKIIQNW